MKLLVFTVVLVFVSIIVSAQVEFPQPKQIAGNLYEVALDGCTSVFLVTDSGVVVVDAGISPMDGHKLKASIASVADKPVKYILLTHHHFDHVGGVQVFMPGAQVIAASGLYFNMQNSGKTLFDNYIAEVETAIHDYQLQTSEQVQEFIQSGATEKADSIRNNILFFQSYVDSCKAVRFVKPDIEFKKSYTITFGGQTIILTHPGPAHTGSDCVVYFPAYNTMHVGDLYLEKTFPLIDKPAGASIDSWIKILGQLADNKKCEKRLICGHGHIADRSDLLIMRQLLMDMKSEVQKAKRSNQPVKETAIKAIMDKYPDYGAPDLLEKDVIMLENAQ